MEASRFVRKLTNGAELSGADKAVLEKAITDIREIRPRTDVIREGDAPNNVHVVMEGFAIRYKQLPDGQRQIMAYLVPGDMCDLHVAILGEMDHTIGTVDTVRMAYIPTATIAELTERHPRINRALWWATLVDEGILRQWIVSMGVREADQRMAHLFCELVVRLQSVGLAADDSFELPMTQNDLGDTLGITTVHVNRTLQKLRTKGLLTLKGKVLSILDLEGLKLFAEYDGSYLHLKNGMQNRVSRVA